MGKSSTVGRLIFALFIAIITVGAGLMPQALGQAGYDVAVGVMAMSNATKQGGKGPSGSTLLTQSEFNYRGDFWALGAFFQYDRQGTAQTDTAAGPKGELYFNPVYVEAGYMLLMQRAFTDRTIAKQTGTGHYVGFGTRFYLTGGGGGGGGGGGSSSGGLFFQFSYRQRVQLIKKQDGDTLSESITQTDSYPLIGLGYHF